MSTQIDNHVVSMTFDNKQFEAGVRTSLGSLQQLKQGLDLGGARKNLNELQKAANAFTLESIADSANTIAARFDHMGIVGMTVLNNLTNSAVNAGKKILNALTLDPVTTGFKEYETQINSVQTILANTASKGTTLSQVNAALDELNRYSDKTIYNFTEMTRNIGTFTAAGVDLNTSVQAIKGIANLAAVSGSTSQQASTAMYQLSQALASGTVKLMDWNSVVNAGMGGQVFQDALKETARLHKINIDAMIERDGSFRETLTHGWLSAEILTDTLAKFTGDLSEAQLKTIGYTDEQIKGIMKLGDMANKAATEVKTMTQLWDTLKEAAQSGWAQTWRIMIGDFEEAKSFFTNVSDELGGLIGKFSDARNEALIQGISTGWQKFMHEGIADEAGLVEEIMKVAGDSKKAMEDLMSEGKTFREIVKEGYVTGDMLKKSVSALTEKVKGYTEEQIKQSGYTKDQIEQLEELNEELQTTPGYADQVAKSFTEISGRENLIQSLTNAFEALKRVIAPIGQAFHEAFGSIRGEMIYQWTEQIKKFSEALILSDEHVQALKIAWQGTFMLLKPVVTAIINSVKIMVHAISKLKPMIGIIIEGASHISLFSQKIGEFVNLDQKLKNGADFMVHAIDTIAEAFHLAGQYVRGFIEQLTGVDVTNFEEVQQTISDILESVKEFGAGLAEAFPNVTRVVSSMAKNFRELADGNNTFRKSNEHLERFLGIVENVKSAVGGFADKVVEALRPVAEKINQMFSDVTITDMIGTGLLGGIFVAVKKMTKETKKISDAVVGVLGEAGDALSAFQNKLDSDTLKNIAISVALLAGGLLILSRVKTENLAGAFVGISAMLFEVIGAMKLLSVMDLKNGAVMKAASSLILMSTAVFILSGALARFKDATAGADTKQLWAAAISMTAMFGAMSAAAVALAKMDSTSGLMQAAFSIVLMSLAFNGLAMALRSFEKVGIDEIEKGLWTLAGVLMEFVVFSEILGKGDLAGCRKVMLEMAFSLMVIAGAIKIMGNFNANELSQGLFTVGLLMVTLAGAMAIIRIESASLKGSAPTILALAAALNILIIPIKILGNMDCAQLGQGLVTVGLALAGLSAGIAAIGHFASGGLVGAGSSILAMALALNMLILPIRILGSMPLTALITGLIGFGGAIAVLAGSAVLLKGASAAMFAMAKSMAMFGIAALGFGAAVGAIAFAFGMLATAGAAGVAAFLAAMTGLLKGITLLAPVIGEAVIAIGHVIIQAIQHLGPDLMETVVILIDQLLIALDNHAPSIVEHLAGFLIKLMDGLAVYIPPIVESAVGLFKAIVTEIYGSLSEVTPANALTMVFCIGAIVQSMAMLARVSTIGKDAIKGAAMSLAAIGLVSLVIAALSAIPTERTVGAAGAISMVLLSVGSSMAIMSKIPTAGAITALKSFAIFLGGFTGIVTILGGLAQIPGFSWLVGEGLNLLYTLGEGLGRFVGSIVGGLGVGMTAGLPVIGENLAKFMGSLKGIDTGVVSGVKALAETVLILTGADILRGLASWFTDGVSLTAFGQELADFSPYISTFYNNVRHVKGDVVQASANAAKALAEMASAVPNVGGVAGFFAGENSLSAFGKELAAFGPHFKSYATSVTGINPDTVTASAAAAESLAELAKLAPNSGGLVALISGDNSLAAFGAELAAFGPHFKTYSDSLAGVDYGIVLKSVDVVGALVEMAKLIPNSGGLFGDIAGDNTLTSFGLQLRTFSYNFAEYYRNISTVNPNVLNAVIRQIESLVKMAEDVTNANIGGLKTFSMDLATIAGQGIDGFLNAFATAYPRATSAMTMFIQTCVTALRNGYSSIYSAGIYLADALVSALNNSIYKMTSAGTNLAQAFTNAIRTQYSSAYSAGGYLTTAFADGITSQTFYAIARAKAMAEAAMAAARSAIGGSIGGGGGGGGRRPISSGGVSLNGRDGEYDAERHQREWEEGTVKEPTKGTKSSWARTPSSLSRNSSHGPRSTGSTTYNFIQNNTSPKALSSSEIYRQTKNQFSSFKRGVNR